MSMGKPRYPAHVVHALARYPAKWCEECGVPVLPRLDPPNRAYRREHLEQLHHFQKRRYCSRACAQRARQRERARGNGKPALEPTTQRLLRDALELHSHPGLELADMFQPATEEGTAT